MKSTGIIRKVDELGRIVIPIELRRTLGVEVKDPLEIFVDGDKIIFRKFMPDVEKENVLKELKALRDGEDWTNTSDILNRAINLIK